MSTHIAANPFTQCKTDKQNRRTSAMNIVTCVCVDSDESDHAVSYPNLVDESNRRTIYWRCVTTFCLTSLRVNPNENHLVYTNDPEEIVIDNFNVKEELKRRGVQIIELPFSEYNPGVYSRKFRNAFYKHEVINAISNLSSASILLDCDSIWTKRDENLFKSISTNRYLLLQDTFQRSANPRAKSPPNLNLKDMGKLFREIDLLPNSPKYPIWYGGEIIGGTSTDLRAIARYLQKVQGYCKQKIDLGSKMEFKNGKSIFSNDEFKSSYVYNSIPNVYIKDTWEIFSKRIWTLPDVNNVKRSDIRLAIWHLPAEKETGLKDLFYEIISPHSEFWHKDASIPIFLAKYVGVAEPRQTRE